MSAQSHDPASADGRRLLHCPRCGLSITPRVHWLVVEHCPRCIARRRVAVKLVFRALPGRPGRGSTPAAQEREGGREHPPDSLAAAA